VWVIPNIEHFLFDRPSTSVSPAGVGLVPDVLNYSWRDYGVRVGIWRLMDVMAECGFKGTVALNSLVCDRYPQIIEAGNALGWEWMGHGETNSTLLTGIDEERETALIRNVLDTIQRVSGTRPRGWLSPALSETLNTLDLLAEAGVDYVCNWVNDEQPYPMKVRRGSLLSMPYTLELNDISAFLNYKLTSEDYARIICDEFDRLYRDGEKTARVMAISLHPFLTGHAHRAKYLEQAFRHIAKHEQVWITRGSEIADWYKKGMPKAAAAS
jgi:peptidoglycan/xylan/chitin deacetylase (PgdA/CDA1 family)